MKLRYLIWLVCLIILLQVGWISFRLEKLKAKKAEELKNQQEQILEQEKQAEEVVLGVPEPEIEEKLAKGGRLWLEPSESLVDGDFSLEVWGESTTGIKKVDLRLFYPAESLNLEGEGWDITEEGVASWSVETESAVRGKFLLTKIAFYPKKVSPGEVVNLKIDLDFNKESLLDCNLLNEEGEDILEAVQGAKINLKI